MGHIIGTTDVEKLFASGSKRKKVSNAILQYYLLLHIFILAGFLAGATRKQTLFLLDEPTTGLHPLDIVKLLSCMDALLEAGHSLIVVEHNVHVMLAADYLIDLGPGAAEQGGQLVAAGTPEQVSQTASSVTGGYLRTALKQART